jgi:TolA-binding protein
MSSSEPFDLIARARRQALPASEERELSVLLRDDPAARGLLEAALQVDRESAPQASDTAWITRMARSVELASLELPVRPIPKRPMRRARKLGRAMSAAPALAAAICFACGAAAAVGVLAVYSSVTSPPATQVLSAGRSHSASAARARPDTSKAVTKDPAPPAASQPELVAAAPKPAPNGPRTTSAKPASASMTSAPTPEAHPVLDSPGTTVAPAPVSVSDATDLYRRANRARQEGRPAEAIAAYLDLQTRYPVSPEAIASHLTLGNLYLLQENAESALRQFRAHLAAGGGGFERESLWGAAVALRRLGRFADERAMLSELVTRYPNSAYELSARRRLQSGD